jgi:RNA polymerase sigma-70 factor, ECF subfamily
MLTTFNDTEDTSFRPAADRRTALDRLARGHAHELYRRALALTKSPDTARDLVQDTFERALRDRTAEVPEAKLRGWLFVIMRNLFIDGRRRDRRQRRWGRTDLPLDDLPAPVPEPPPRWESLSVAEVRASLEALDEPFRSVYRLHVFEGLCYGDIAARLGVRPATVGTRLFRARSLLRAALVSEARAA